VSQRIVTGERFSRKISLLPVQKAEVCIPSLRGNFGLFVAELTTASLMEFDGVESRFKIQTEAHMANFLNPPSLLGRTNAILRVYFANKRAKYLCSSFK